jgi:hypothetical protein
MFLRSRWSAANAKCVQMPTSTGRLSDNPDPSPNGGKRMRAKAAIGEFKSFVLFGFDVD